MKAVVVSVVLALAVAASPALAQGVQESLELSREVIDQQKRVIVAGSLPLSDEEADAFWPLFDEFQKELKKLDGRSDRLIASYTAELATLTDCPRAVHAGRSAQHRRGPGEAEAPVGEAHGEGAAPAVSWSATSSWRTSSRRW